MELVKTTGRPPHQPTDATRHRVAVAAAAGMTHDNIALGLGISRPTLEKWYGHELSQGACDKRMAILEAVFEQALKGNTAAAKASHQLCPIPEPPPPEALPEGIKAQRDAVAKTVQDGTDWERLGIQ